MEQWKQCPSQGNNGKSFPGSHFPVKAGHLKCNQSDQKSDEGGYQKVDIVRFTVINRKRDRQQHGSGEEDEQETENVYDQMQLHCLFVNVFLTKSME